MTDYWGFIAILAGSLWVTFLCREVFKAARDRTCPSCSCKLKLQCGCLICLNCGYSRG